MSRDDAILNTGASSAAFGSTRAQQQLDAKKQERSEETKSTQNVVNPTIEPFLEIVQKEIDSLWDIRNYTDEHINSPEDITVEIRARKIAEGRLLSIKKQTQNIKRAK